MERASGLAAAILAGGRARRLGGINKAALEIDGRTIAERQFAVLDAIAAPVFVVGGDPGRWPESTRVVADAVPDAGALGGIYTAILESPCDRVLVVGCDMPFLSPRFLRMLAEVRDADVVMPRSARGYEPLCAIYGKACAAGFRNRIDRGELHAAVRPEGVRVTEIGPDVLATYDPDGLLLANINTPHDYARIVSLKIADRRIEDR
jgi:molybdopterin-guanine dinucleotide biosynthesis protein A